MPQPQDHKPKKGEPFRFTDKDGKSHTLPLASKARGKIPGRDMRDAVLGGELGQMAYMFKVLEAAEPPAKTLDALYAMPQADMLDVLEQWGDHGDGDGASLGE